MRLMRGLPQRLPSGVASQLGVLPGEKVIAWGSHAPVDDVPANYAIATSRALYLQVPSIRIPWHEVSKATWTEPVLEITPEGASGPAFRVDLDEARDLPAAVHDRVTDSVVISEWVELTPTAGARMVARRDSDDGSIHWSVVFDAGLDPADPGLRATVDEALGRLRDALGI